MNFDRILRFGSDNTFLVLFTFQAKICLHALFTCCFGSGRHYEWNHTNNNITLLLLLPKLSTAPSILERELGRVTVRKYLKLDYEKLWHLRFFFNAPLRLSRKVIYHDKWGKAKWANSRKNWTNKKVLNWNSCWNLHILLIFEFGNSRNETVDVFVGLLISSGKFSKQITDADPKL